MKKLVAFTCESYDYSGIVEVTFYKRDFQRKPRWIQSGRVGRSNFMFQPSQCKLEYKQNEQKHEEIRKNSFSI